MATRTREDRRLRLLSAVCLGLPEAERTTCGAHADFRVGGRIFAYFLRNHGGDGITAACFKSKLGQHVEHVKRAPDRFYLPHYLGRRGWVGVRLDQGEIDWEEVAILAAISFNLVAPPGMRPSPAPPPARNALTSRALVRGAPPALLTGNLPNPEPLTQESGVGGQRMRSTALPRTAIIRRSGGLRSRR